MQIYVQKVIDMMKKEKLFASQGGPIILAQVRTANLTRLPRVAVRLYAASRYPGKGITSVFISLQIENEYNHVQLAYRKLSNQYVQWAGNTMVELALTQTQK